MFAYRFISCCSEGFTCGLLSRLRPFREPTALPTANISCRQLDTRPNRGTAHTIAATPEDNDCADNVPIIGNDLGNMVTDLRLMFPIERCAVQPSLPLRFALNFESLRASILEIDGST